MPMRRFLAGSLLALIAATTVAAQDVSKVPAVDAPRIEALASPVTVRLRGLSAVDENIAWASGREGTVIRTTDAGKTWSVFKVPGADELDFRDVEGFSANEAVILSIGPGEASRVYRTSDGGRTWMLALQNRNPKAFFDCLDFHGREGRMLGDPVDGHFQVYGSSDAGQTWSLLPDGPVAKKDEAAFAASGTCIARGRDFTAIVTGGSVARVLFSPDRVTGKGRWRSIVVPVEQPASSAGLFSVTFRNSGLLAVGGDFQKPDAVGLATAANASSSVVKFGGTPEPDPRWNDVLFEEWLNFGGRPLGYRSGVACLSRQGLCIATGPGGTDVLPSFALQDDESWWNAGDDKPGEKSGDGILSVRDVRTSGTWTRLSQDGYDSVDQSGRVFWFSGDGGRIGRLELPPPANVSN